MRIVTRNTKGDFATGIDVELYDGDRKLNGVASVQVDMCPDDVVRAKCTVFVDTMDVEAEGRFVAIHPVSGELMELRRMEFADGTEWSANG